MSFILIFLFLIFPFCAAATPPVHHHGGVRAPLPVSPVCDSVVVLVYGRVFSPDYWLVLIRIVASWPFLCCSDSVLILDAIGRTLLRSFHPLVSVTVSPITLSSPMVCNHV